MALKREIELKIEEGIALRNIVSAYAEISAIKLKKIKNKIQQNKKFTKELSRVFHIVRRETIRRKIFPKIKFEGTAHIIITSNFPFYGTLERRLLRDYIKRANFLHPKLRIVIGKTGNQFLKSINFKLSFESFILKKDIPSLEELEYLTRRIRNFKNILVFYSVFDSLLIQMPTFTNITRPFLFSKEEEKEEKEKRFCHIFEPEIEDMFYFFNTQIIQILLEETFLEAELSRTASRLVTMNEGEGKAENFIKEQTKILKMIQKNLINFRFLEIFPSLKNWRKEIYYGG